MPNRQPPLLRKLESHQRAMWNCFGLGTLLWGSKMSNEETIQLEEAQTVAEQETWEHLHEAIFKELFPQSRKAVKMWRRFLVS